MIHEWEDYGFDEAYRRKPIVANLQYSWYDSYSHYLNAELLLSKRSLTCQGAFEELVVLRKHIDRSSDDIARAIAYYRLLQDKLFGPVDLATMSSVASIMQRFTNTAIVGLKDSNSFVFCAKKMGLLEVDEKSRTAYLKGSALFYDNEYLEKNARRFFSESPSPYGFEAILEESECLPNLGQIIGS